MPRRGFALAIARDTTNRDTTRGMFRAQLQYKAELYDRRVVCINRFFPSSKKCSSCGNVKAELPLSQRTYHCDNCGLTLDRDLNAALNILAAGQAVKVCGDSL